MGEDASGDEAVQHFVEKFALMLTAYGMQRMAARVFGALLATQHGRMTAAEIAESLQVSPAAVSGAVRYLSQVGMIHRGREPGARRDHFTIAEDQWLEMVSRQDNVYVQLARVLDEGVAAVGERTVAGERLGQTRDFFEYMAKEVPLLIERFNAERRHG